MNNDTLINEAVKAEILENAPVLVAFHDVRHHILWANKAYREATNASPQQLRSRKCYYNWGLSKPCRNCPVTKALKTGNAAEAELTPETQEHWPESQGSWLSKAIPIRNKEGVVIGAVEVAFNISRRRKAENFALQARGKVRHLEILEALYIRAQKMAENLDHLTVVRECLRTSVDVLGASMAWIGRTEKDGSVTMLSQLPPPPPLPPLSPAGAADIRRDSGAANRALRSGHPQIIHDILSEAGFAEWRGVAKKYHLRSAAVLPLVSRGSGIGTLHLYSDQPGFFGSHRRAILKTFAHQVASALENALLFEENSRRITRLNALRNIDMAITGSVDLRVTYMVALDEIVGQFNVDAAAILRINPHTRMLEYVAGRGFLGSGMENFSVQIGQGCAGRAAMEGRMRHVHDVSEPGQELARRELLAEEKFVSYYAAPMIAKAEVLGVLAVFQRTAGKEDRDWPEFLEALAGQVAIAISNATLFQDLEQMNMELLQAYDATIEGWARALSLKEEETEEHSKRVVALTVEIAREMGMNDADIMHLRRGCLLHDIGKIGIPDSILLKAGRLNDAEWAVMRKHPEYAFQMLSQVLYLRQAVDIPYCHHEKWDGTGYPRGLKGEQIPLPARIFEVVDVWDALTRDRPYRKAWPEKKALNYILARSGKHFDPAVVDVFAALMEKSSRVL